MPCRYEPLVTENYYHVYNRGVAKQEIFLSPRHYFRFERTLDYYRAVRPTLRFSKFLNLKFINPRAAAKASDPAQQNQIELVAYCLMPNHFHLILRQCIDNGISNFMRNVGNSYSRYFNTVSYRVGPVFQGQFKAIHIKTESYLLHLSRYIHLNPYTAGICSKNGLKTYSYSSFSQYVSNECAGSLVVNPGIVLGQFGPGINSYQQFCLNLNDYQETVTHFADILIDGAD